MCRQHRFFSLFAIPGASCSAGGALEARSLKSWLLTRRSRLGQRLFNFDAGQAPYGEQRRSTATPNLIPFQDRQALPGILCRILCRNLRLFSLCPATLQELCARVLIPSRPPPPPSLQMPSLTAASARLVSVCAICYMQCLLHLLPEERRLPFKHVESRIDWALLCDSFLCQRKRGQAGILACPTHSDKARVRGARRSLRLRGGDNDDLRILRLTIARL